MGTTAAILGAGAIGAGASIYAGNKQSSATKSAANKTAQAQNYAADLQFKQYQQTREDQEPWRVAGENALNVIQTQPDFQFTADDFEKFKDPGYDFVKQEGINALDRSAASRGRLLSGGQDRAVTRYATGLASNEYQNAFNRGLTTYNENLRRKQSLAGVGQNATNLVSQAGQNMASNVANGAINSAAQQGNALIAGGNAQANAINGVAKSVNNGVGNYLLYTDIKNGSLKG